MKTLHRTLTILCCFAAALLIAWKLLHTVNYGYDFWYPQLSISSHISKFAPLNRKGKMGFEKTTQEERTELFRSIGHAVNNSGEGLRSLSYQAHPKTEPQLLLTDPEATHLEDVANLIDVLEPIGWAATGLLVALIIFAVLGNFALPKLSASVITLLVIALILALIIGIVGPQVIFKGLHEAVFPDEHQWFFYYQDSLMTTLMKAPDIFYAIGALWALLAAIVYLVISLLFRVLDSRRTLN